MKKLLVVLISCSMLVNIILVAYILSYPRPTQKSELNVKQETLKYLSQRVFIENPNDYVINFVPLRKELNAYTDTLDTSFGMYFEYLPTGVSIGINEKESYILASLLKVPLAMAVYKQIEKGDLKSDQTLEVKKEHLDPYFGELWKAGPGQTLTTTQALQETLINSDNTAKNVLFSAIPEGSLENVFDSLDIPKELTNNSPVVTPKNYSSVLRSLYLSSYLKPEDSNEILSLLTRTPFSDKLAAGVPKDVKVAHKIGVHEGENKDTSIFTDCGIIYYPKRPYILCMMTRSPEKDTQKNMKNVSKIIYDYISKL